MLHFIGFPGLDLDQGLWRAWWMDPLIATLSFAVFINWYWYYERRLGISSVDEFQATVKLEWGPLFQSGAAYWVGIFILKCFVPPSATTLPDGTPQDINEFAYLIAEVISGILLYDAIFFFIHWAFHEIPALRWIHQRHHQYEGTIESRDVLRHSLLDGGLQVVVNIIVQRYTPWGTAKSRVARALHNIIVVWMLTESHSAAPRPYIWRRYFVGVREHREHHLGKQINPKLGKFHRYQQFFAYLDDARAFLNGHVSKRVPP